MGGRRPRTGGLTAVVLVVVVVVALVAVVAPVLPATATAAGNTQTYVVDDETADESSEDCPADFQSIQAAVDAAEPGDTVHVCGGEYELPPHHEVESYHEMNVTTPNLTIRATGQAVIPRAVLRVRASEVTLRGFTLSNSTIHIKNATRVRILDNTFAGSTLVRVLTTAPQTRILNNTIDHHEIAGADSPMVLGGPETLVRDNTIRSVDKTVNENPTRIEAGGCERCSIVANTIVNTSVRLGPESVFRRNLLDGGSVGTNANKTEITGNVIRDSEDTYGVWWAIEIGMASIDPEAFGNVVRNNTITVTGTGIAVEDSAYNTTVRNNTVTGGGNGVTVKGDRTAVLGNTLTRGKYGVNLDDDGPANPSIRVVGNQITNNTRAGVKVWPNFDVARVAVHRNRFRDNGKYAINNRNESSILNATNNDWGGALPSSPTQGYALQDPVSGRLANGTGGAVSEGARQGVSNVHFFRPGEDEGDGPEETPTPTLTPTATPTPTSTPTAGTGDGSGATGDGASGASGLPTATPPPTTATGPPTATASPTATAPAPLTASATATALPTLTPAATATPPPTATTTPPPSPGPTTPTVTLTEPTPLPQPGLGVAPGVVAIALLVGLLAIRRREG